MLRSKQGFSLPLMLLILSAVLLSTLLIVKLVMNELKISVSASNSVVAFHAAESGIEQALWNLKHGREISDFSNYQVMPSLPAVDLGASTYQVSEATLGADYTTVYNLSPSVPAHFDILDPTGAMNAQVWNGISDRITFNWFIKDCFPAHASDRLQISYHSFDIGANPASPEYTSDVESSVAVCNCEFGNEICSGVVQISIDNAHAYRVTARPLDSEVSRITFSSNNEDIISEAIISSVGVSGQSSYRIKVQAPIFSSVSDIFTYTIFSESELTK